MSGYDVEEVEDGDALLRRVPNRPSMFTRKGGTLRPSSGAFQPTRADDGVSVDVRRLLPDPSDPECALRGRLDDGLVELLARVPREHALDVHHTPQEENPAHADIIGWRKFPREVQKRKQRELALSCVWVRQPAAEGADGDSLPP